MGLSEETPEDDGIEQPEHKLRKEQVAREAIAHKLRQRKLNRTVMRTDHNDTDQNQKCVIRRIA